MIDLLSCPCSVLCISTTLSNRNRHFVCILYCMRLWFTLFFCSLQFYAKTLDDWNPLYGTTLSAGQYYYIPGIPFCLFPKFADFNNAYEHMWARLKCIRGECYACSFTFHTFLLESKTSSLLYAMELSQDIGVLASFAWYPACVYLHLSAESAPWYGSELNVCKRIAALWTGRYRGGLARTKNHASQ